VRARRGEEAANPSQGALRPAALAAVNWCAGGATRTLLSQVLKSVPPPRPLPSGPLDKRNTRQPVNCKRTSRPP
jgi:hypothetical protein